MAAKATVSKGIGRTASHNRGAAPTSTRGGARGVSRACACLSRHLPSSQGRQGRQRTRPRRGRGVLSVSSANTTSPTAQRSRRSCVRRHSSFVFSLHVVRFLVASTDRCLSFSHTHTVSHSLSQSLWPQTHKRGCNPKNQIPFQPRRPGAQAQAV